MRLLARRRRIGDSVPRRARSSPNPPARISVREPLGEGGAAWTPRASSCLSGTLPLKASLRRLASRITSATRKEPHSCAAPHSVAEVLGRYSNLDDTGVAVRSMRNRVTKNIRSEPWQAPKLGGGNGTRQTLAGHEACVRADYEAGMGSVLLSKKYGLPVNTLLDWLRREGVQIRSGRKLSAGDMVEVRQLRSEGWSHQKIADRFGVSRSAVSLRLKGAH